MTLLAEKAASLKSKRAKTFTPSLFKTFILLNPMEDM